MISRPTRLALKLTRFVIGLALGAFPVFGGERPDVSNSVTLYTAFQQAPPAAVVDAIGSEIDGIMLSSGLRFNWHPLSEAPGRVSTELVVIRLKGQCDAEDIRPEWGYPGPLGWTYVSDGEILAFIDINCDGVRLLVQRNLTSVPAVTRNSVFGRAIARVLAHELYHFLAHTKHHSRTGIANAAFTAEDLLAPASSETSVWEKGIRSTTQTQFCVARHGQRIAADRRTIC